MLNRSGGKAAKKKDIVCFGEANVNFMAAITNNM